MTEDECNPINSSQRVLGRFPVTALVEVLRVPDCCGHIRVRGSVRVVRRRVRVRPVCVRVLPARLLPVRVVHGRRRRLRRRIVRHDGRMIVRRQRAGQ